jgi:hypothetical protein
VICAGETGRTRADEQHVDGHDFTRWGHSSS